MPKTASQKMNKVGKKRIMRKFPSQKINKVFQNGIVPKWNRDTSTNTNHIDLLSSLSDSQKAITLAYLPEQLS